MTRTSNIGDVARRIRDQYTIPLTAGKSIARALAATGALDLALDTYPVQRAVDAAREHGGKLTLEQAVAAIGVLFRDGKGMDYSQYPEGPDRQASMESVQRTYEHLHSLRASPEQIAAQWAANRGVQPRLTLGQFQAPLGERLVLSGTAGTGKSYALTNMLLTLCSEHGPDQVQLLIGESDLPSIGRHCADLPHTICAFDRMEYGSGPFLRALRYELAKRRRLWREGRERFMRLPALIVVLDGFDGTLDLHPDVFRALNGIRGDSDNAVVLMTELFPGLQQLRQDLCHQLEFGRHGPASTERIAEFYAGEVLRELLDQPPRVYFQRGDHGGQVAIHTSRPAPPSTAATVSRVVDSPQLDDTFRAAVAAGIRAAAAVKDARPVTPTARPDVPEAVKCGEDRLLRGAHVHDVLFPGLSVRTVTGIANDPQTTIETMDLAALLPEHAPHDDALIVVRLKERVRQPNGGDRVWVRAHAVGNVDPVAVEQAVRDAQISVRDRDADLEQAVWRSLAKRESPS